MKILQLHSTDDEILFIQSIGKHCHNAKRIPRLSILKKYIASCYARIEWNGINGEEVIKFAEREYQDELQRPKS